LSALPPSFDADPDDLLQRAEDALRDRPLPDGPSDAILAKVLSALEDIPGQPPASLPESNPLPRKRTMIVLLKVAAAVVLATGGISYFAPPPAGPMAAFAQAAVRLREAETLSYKMTMNLPEQKMPMTMKCIFRSPSLARAEVPGGVVTILDVSQGKTLVLQPASKSALLLEGKTPLGPGGKNKKPGLDFIDHLRTLEKDEGVAVGERTIDGVKTRGFKVKKPDVEMTYWIDPKTGIPALVETQTNLLGKEYRGTLSDFAINPPLDDALFSLKPPEGYTLQKADADFLGDLEDDKKFLNLEDAAIQLLKRYAEKSGGKFPAKIDDLSMFETLEPKKKVPGALPDPEAFQTGMILVRFMMASRKSEGTYGYKADGVKLGDADTIVFWSRPKGSEKYRAVYGDLHAAEVSADKLPEKPKP
jgi:outer membrane lipoprotein-sorting protein